MPRLFFFGTDSFSAPSLVALIEAGYEIAAVVTKPNALIGRGRTLTPPVVKTIAQEHHIPVLQPAKLGELEAQLRGFDADAAIVASYGRIIPTPLLGVTKHGFINVHASLLPRYRGASPIEAAILNGDSKTGVTIMRVEPAMDTGAIYAMAEVKLTDNETRPELYEELAQLGARTLVGNLPAILDDSLPAQPQDEAQATHVGKIRKAAGIIDWRKSATQIEREIRGYLGWPGSRATFHGVEVIITAAHVTLKEPNPRDLVRSTGSGQLIIDRLKPAGKREMTGREFLAGHRNQA